MKENKARGILDKLKNGVPVQIEEQDYTIEDIDINFIVIDTNLDFLEIEDESEYDI